MAIEECLALSLEGVRGMVADSKASSRRTLGVCLEPKIDLVSRRLVCHALGLDASWYAVPFAQKSAEDGQAP